MENIEENVEQLSINLEKVNKIKNIMPDDELIFDVAESFKVFGDSTRMKIIAALLQDELNVSEIAAITSSHICHITPIKSFKTSKICKSKERWQSCVL